MMKKRKFGKADIDVSETGMGCLAIGGDAHGNSYGPTDDETSIAAIKKALEMGCTFFDTADVFGHGHSEELLGRALKDVREKVFVATSVGRDFYGPRPKRNFTPLYIGFALNQSLERLQTDYIDLYLLHHPDSKTPVEETLSTLDTLINQGKVRYIGVCNHYAWQMAHMLGVSALHNWEPLVCIQCRYNILDRVIENETVPFCQRFNIATMVYGPLCGGLLAGLYKRGEPLPEGARSRRSEWIQKQEFDENLFDILEELEQIAGDRGIELGDLAYGWLVAKPYVTSVIMGGSRAEHYQALWDVLEVELDSEDIERIDELSEVRRHRSFANQPTVQGAPLALNWL